MQLYGDLTGDGIAGFNDLLDFFGYWLQIDCALASELDLDGDCTINFHEFLQMAKN